MKCAKCKKDTPNGSFYGFYFGKHLSTRQVRSDSLARNYRSTFDIGGARAAWICKRCVNRRLWTSGFYFSLIIAGLGLLIAFLPMGEDSALLGLILFIISIFVFMTKFIFNTKLEPIKVAGDDQAIASYRKDLENKGWDTFINRARSASMDQKPLDVWVKRVSKAELEKQGLLGPDV